MGKVTKLQLVAEPEAEARRALADEIARVTVHAEELRRLNDAAVMAADRRREAEAALGELQAERASLAASFGQRFVQSMRESGAVDEAEIAAGAKEDAAREAELQRAVEMWRNAEREAAREVEAIRTRFTGAKAPASAYLAAVVSASGRCEAVLDAARAARADLIRHRSALEGMSRTGLLTAAEHATVQRFLFDVELPGASVTYADWKREPAYLAWTAAAAALAVDAAAPLPEV